MQNNLNKSFSENTSDKIVINPLSLLNSVTAYLNKNNQCKKVFDYIVEKLIFKKIKAARVR